MTKPPIIRVISWGIAMVGAVLIEILIAVTTSLAAAREYLYGAPIALGVCRNVGFFSVTGGCDFSYAIFAVDVVLTAAVLVVAAEIGGVVGVVSGTLGGLAVAMWFPRSPDGAALLVPEWLGVAIVALGIAGLVGRGARWLRASRLLRSN